MDDNSRLRINDNGIEERFCTASERHWLPNDEEHFALRSNGSGLQTSCRSCAAKRHARLARNKAMRDAVIPAIPFGCLLPSEPLGENERLSYYCNRRHHEAY